MSSEIRKAPHHLRTAKVKAEMVPAQTMTIRIERHCAPSEVPLTPVWQLLSSFAMLEVIEALAPVEQTCSKHHPDSAEAVDLACVHQVVNLQLLKEHGGRLVNNGSDQSNSEGSATLDASAGCCNRDEPRQDVVGKPANIVLAHEDVAQEDGDAAGGRLDCVHSHLCGRGALKCTWAAAQSQG